jgi:hemerythrin-like domain-containing protein
VHQDEVIPERVAQLDQRLQAVEEAVSQLCTLHEQTLQLVAQLYDVMTTQKAQDIETVTGVLRKAQQYVEHMHVRTHTPEPEPSSSTDIPAVASS